MTALIGQDTCGACRFGKRTPEGVLECRHSPPSATVITALTPKGPQMLGVATAWPQPSPDGYCFRFERGVVIKAS